MQKIFHALNKEYDDLRYLGGFIYLVICDVGIVVLKWQMYLEEKFPIQY